MRLPRGYTVTGSVEEVDGRPSCPSTRWRVRYGDDLVVDEPVTDVYVAIGCAWAHAVELWLGAADALGVKVNHGSDRGAESARISIEEAGHALVYDTGKVSFAGKAGARQRLATKLREAGLLRGCDRKALGGEWDLPGTSPAKATMGDDR